MRYGKRIRTAGYALVALVAVGLAGCVDNPVTTVTDDRPVLRFTAEPGESVFPSANADLQDILIANFDFSVADGFARSVAPADAFYAVDNPFGATNAYEVALGVPGSAADSRLPAVEGTDFTVNFWGLFNPGWTGIGTGVHDLFGQVESADLEVGDTLSVVLARMSVNVNGELDQNEILTGRSVANPDQLNFLGGTPTGYPGVQCDFSQNSPITASTNPVMLGYIVVEEAGVVTVDCRVAATGDSPWYRDATTTSPAGATNPDSMPFGANVPGATLAPGQFNYVLLYEGVGTQTDPIPTSNPAVRIQVGPDIDSNGNVITNGHSPFPTDVADVSDLGNLPGGAEAFAAPGTVEFSVTGLPSLPGRVYQTWLYNRDDDTYTPAEGTITMGEQETQGSTFNPDAVDTEAVITLSDYDFGSYTHLVLSHEASAAATPSATTFLFKEYLTENLALSDGAAVFGGFDGAGATRQYLAGGSGIGEFFSDSLFVRLRRMPRPAEGFHYQSYLARFVGPELEATQRLHQVQLNQVGNFTDRIGADEVGAFSDFNTYVIVQEPDGVNLFTSMRIQVSEDYVAKFTEFFEEEGEG